MWYALQFQLSEPISPISVFIRIADIKSHLFYQATEYIHYSCKNMWNFHNNVAIMSHSYNWQFVMRVA